MNQPINKLNSSKSWLSLQTIVLAAISWAVLALLFALLFSVPVVEVQGVVPRRTQWYIVSAYIFQSVAYLSSVVLCLRNMLQPNIISGRSVWLGIGFGLGVGLGVGFGTGSTIGLSFPHPMSTNKRLPTNAICRNFMPLSPK